MPHRLHRLIAAFIIGAGIVLLHHTSVFAQSTNQQSITVSPASTELSVDPGKTVEKSLDVINSGADTFSVKVYASPYHVVGENYDPAFTQLPGTIDASAWVKLYPTKKTVDGYKLLTVPYTITVPAGTAPGGYYAVIFAETSTDTSASGVLSRNRVGDILYITVNGTVTTSGQVTPDPLPLFTFGGPVSIGTKVSNSGGVHFKTTSVYSVTDITGKTVFTSRQEKYVLPQTVRQVAVSWTPSSLFNIYTIHRSASVGDMNKQLPDQKITVISPVILIGAVVIIGIAIGILFGAIRRRRHVRR